MLIAVLSIAEDFDPTDAAYTLFFRLRCDGEGGLVLNHSRGMRDHLPNRHYYSSRIIRWNESGRGGRTPESQSGLRLMEGGGRPKQRSQGERPRR